MRANSHLRAMSPRVVLETSPRSQYARLVAPRRDEPKVLDTGRVTLAMRARQTDGGRFPFLRSERRRYTAAAVATGIALAAIAAALILALR